MSRDQNQPKSGTAGRQPRLLADRYDVIDIIGSGATAITWRGHDRRLDRPVAIKILRTDEEQDPDYVQRFEREARASAAVSSGNVVNVFDVGQEDGWLYLVMQLVDGEDLKHTLARRGHLPPEEAIDITRQVLNGLTAIHRAGILHRDIKPQNVLIDRAGPALVTDFGIAQTQVDPALTAAGSTVGTAAYMAPEQARAEPLSEATDIYAVGVMLYEMLTGTLPFERPSAMATMLAHLQDDLEPPSVRAPHLGISRQLDGIVAQAMARAPSDRFRTASAMRGALSLPAHADWGETRVTPTAQPGRQATRVAPRGNVRDQAWPEQSRPVRTPESRAPAPLVPVKRSGSGFLTFLFVLLLLATAVVAAWLAYEYIYLDDDQNDPVTETPASSTDAPATDEPATDAPATDVEVIIDPPTVEPTATEAPTEEPTEEPTELPIEQSDDIIGPDGTPGGG